MFKIGEFSKLAQVSVRMLRYYDETGLLKPAQTDPATNYRLYSVEQLPVLNKIIFLRDLGFNISEIAAALTQWEDSLIEEQLENKRLEIEHTIKNEQDKLAKIELAKKDIHKNTIALHYNITLKSVPGYQVFSLRRTVPDYYAEGLLWKEMSAFSAKHNIPLSEDTFTIYHDPEYKESNVDIEICSPVPYPVYTDDCFTYRLIEPVPVMASTMVYGSFENIAGAYLSFAGWLLEHPHYRMGTQSRQIIHRGPWNEKEPERYLIELQIPLIENCCPLAE